ncbi:MAG: dihydroneopterin aldolase [Clostridia bacterium]|nr:dihydroneopterin aldolase [Clostridia bacterium]
MKNDKIIMSNMAFFGTHGVLKEENVLGQKFFVDIELYVDTKPAGLSDEITMSVHYGEVYQVVKSIVEDKQFKLLEALAENISIEILNAFNLVKGLKVKIKKPEAPVPGIFDYFAVEIERFRNA